MLSRLKLRDFRCFETLEIEIGSPTAIFVGANAQGKTSILEAICVLLRLQSPRVNVLTHAVRHEARGFVVDGHFDRRHLQFYYSKARKKLALDAVEQRNAREYLQVARVVYFSNDDIDIARGSAEHRRRFLDFLGTQLITGYRTTLRAYERALRSRNRLLKMPSPPRREIDAFTAPLIDSGSRLQSMRARLLNDLGPAAAAALGAISSRSEAFDLGYAAGGGENFARTLKTVEEEDFRRGLTTAGPHRDDIRMSLNGVDSLYASEGQQRSMVLALKVGQERMLREATGTPPVLLVDDVFGELDLARRNALLAALPGDCQRFITTTHLDWMTESAAAVYRVAGGGVEREG